MNFVAIFIGGGIGSLLRYSISLLFQKFSLTQFPFATLLSNLLACLFMGFALYYFKQKAIQTEWLNLFLLTGFCGGFSTFSTFSFETFQLFQQGAVFYAILNVVLSVILGLVIMYFILKN